MKLLSIFSILLLSLSLFILSCGKAEDLENEITDPEGVTIELIWSNTSTNPTVSTDLELYVRQDFKSLMQSINYNSFETLNITPGLLNNGTYTLEVYVDDIDRPTNYSITVIGKSTGKKYTRNFGPINANDINSTLKPLSLSISSSLYTVL
jgi:hypothetical protein